MGAARGSYVLLELWLSLYLLAASPEYLSPPKNITFGMNGMFCLQWQWEPPEKKSNCSLKYHEKVLPPNGNMSSLQEGRGDCAHFEVHVRNYDLNSEIIFEVVADCDKTHIRSKSVRLAKQIAPGSPRTSVNNVSCVWYFLEYVNCTWQPGQEQPANVNYSMLYWITDESDCSPGLTQRSDESHCSQVSQPTQFHNLLETGKHCENYTHENGIPVGCLFRIQTFISKFSNLVIVVTDTSKDVKPFISYIHLNNIAKPRPPTIYNVHRTSKQGINISWNKSEVHAESIYQVHLESINGAQDFKDILGVNKEIPNAMPDVTYTVKVRVRLPNYATTANNFLWSEWSEMKTLPGTDGGKTISLILLVLIPVIVITAAVILLIYMKRLQILIFPRIPDPGKVLSNDLQQWIKNGRSVYNEPKKEEICHVSLLESPLCSSALE